MNRSRYVPPTAYPINPYSQQPFGPVSSASGMQGMMPAPPLAMPSQPYSNQQQPGMGQSPVQSQMSPSPMWSSNFNGPIIEDLCAPPPPFFVGLPSASPPLNALPPRMAIAGMPHPAALPQVQNVYGIHQPTPHPFAQPPPMHHPAGQPGQGHMGAMPSARVVGSYPPYAAQPGPAGGVPVPPFPQRPAAAMMGVGAPRLEAMATTTTGFPSAPTPVVGANAPGMQQISSPPMGGGSPGPEGLQPLTPVEEALRGFLSPDLGDLAQS